MDIVGLGKFIEGVSGRVLDYAMVLAAVGVLAMALLELLKSLLRLRKHYHASRIRGWIRDWSVYRSLLALAVGGEDNAGALFDQPTAKMMGQIQAAANIAIEFPESYPEFFHFMTALPEHQAAKDDVEKWTAYAARAARGGINKENMADQQLIRNGTQARARLDHLVARKLDAFQTTTEYRWTLLNQAVSVALGTLVLWYVLAQLKAPGAAYVIAVVGGMVAPFAKDVVSALSGLRATRT